MFFVKRKGGSQSTQKEKKGMACQNTFLHNKILKLFYYRKCTTYSLAGQPVLRKARETTNLLLKHCTVNFSLEGQTLSIEGKGLAPAFLGKTAVYKQFMYLVLTQQS